jgi:hypothetical protein
MRAHLFNSITPTLRDWSGFFCLSVQFGGITASTWLASPKEETECFGREFFVCFLLLHLLHRGVYRIPRNSRRLERRAFAQSSDTSWTTLKRFLFPATVEHFFVSCSDFFLYHIYTALYPFVSGCWSRGYTHMFKQSTIYHSASQAAVRCSLQLAQLQCHSVVPDFLHRRDPSSGNIGRAPLLEQLSVRAYTFSDGPIFSGRRCPYFLTGRRIVPSRESDGTLAGEGDRRSC